MKYVITWEIRPAVTEEAAARALQVFAKWTPSEEATFKEFLSRVDGRGGFAVVETDDPALIAKDVAPFGGRGSTSASTRCSRSRTARSFRCRPWSSSGRSADPGLPAQLGHRR